MSRTTVVRIASVLDVMRPKDEEMRQKLRFLTERLKAIPERKRAPVKSNPELVADELANELGKDAAGMELIRESQKLLDAKVKKVEPIADIIKRMGL